MHDGPGLLSSVLSHSNGGHFNLSSFHCYIKLFHNVSDVDISLRYWSHLTKVDQIVNIPRGETAKITLPLSHCGSFVCLLKLFSDSEKLINTTITAVVYKGIITQSCLHGGVVVVDLPNMNEFKEHFLLCQNHSSKTYPSRSFYSSKTTMIILLYKFPSYSLVKASLLSTTTKCQAVQICPCSLQKECDMRWSFLPTPFNYNETRCSMFLNHTSNSAGIKLRKQEHAFFEAIQVESVFNHCVIIQIAQNDTCYPMT